MRIKLNHIPLSTMSQASIQTTTTARYTSVLAWWLKITSSFDKDFHYILSPLQNLTNRLRHLANKVKNTSCSISIIMAILTTLLGMWMVTSATKKCVTMRVMSQIAVP